MRQQAILAILAVHGRVHGVTIAPNGDILFQVRENGAIQLATNTTIILNGQSTTTTTDLTLTNADISDIEYIPMSSEIDTIETYGRLGENGLIQWSKSHDFGVVENISPFAQNSNLIYKTFNKAIVRMDKRYDSEILNGSATSALMYRLYMMRKMGVHLMGCDDAALVKYMRGGKNSPKIIIHWDDIMWNFDTSPF